MSGLYNWNGSREIPIMPEAIQSFQSLKTEKCLYFQSTEIQMSSFNRPGRPTLYFTEFQFL